MIAAAAVLPVSLAVVMTAAVREQAGVIGEQAANASGLSFGLSDSDAQVAGRVLINGDDRFAAGGAGSTVEPGSAALG